MGSTQTAPRANRLAPGSAGHKGRVSRDFPREGYHGGGRDARPELVRVQTPQGMRVVGAFVRHADELTFEKKGDARAHMLQKPEGWAVDTGALEEAARRGVQRVVVRDREHGIWWARLADFAKHGLPINRGWGPQVVLCLAWWSFVPTRSTTVRQGSLFADVAA